jgi:D-glycero-alpha-D-manno-heptose 1-phosphate guanylyltransferase
VISALVLAGGLGTRLRSAVPDLPKPMAPINGRPFLEYLLDYWINQGVDRFVLSVGYRHEMITEHFGIKYKEAIIEYVIEKPLLGTGGGFLLGSQKIVKVEPFLLLNGDTFFAVNLRSLIDFSTANKADWCFSLFRSNELGRYMGLEISPVGAITSLNSGASQLSCLSNGGVYWVTPGALAEETISVNKKISLEADLFPAYIASGKRLFGLEFSKTFIDIGVPSDYHRASTILTDY